MGPRPRSSLRMVQRTRPPQASLVSLRSIRLRHPHCPGDRRIAAARTGRAHAARPVQRSKGWTIQPALSRAPSPPRSGSGPNDSWRRASA
jgi:hypothetical protein